MKLAREFKETAVARTERDRAFAQALLDEAVTLFLNGDPNTVKVILHELVDIDRS